MDAIASRAVLTHLSSMRIACPACSIAYDVPDSLVTPGRVVRCARCAQQWMPVPVAAEPEPVPPAAEPAVAAAELATETRPIRSSAMDRLAAHPAWPHASFGLRLAWAASVLVLVLALIGAYVWRNDIVVAWPPSARGYAAFGLHPQGRSAHD